MFKICDSQKGNCQNCQLNCIDNWQEEKLTWCLISLKKRYIERYANAYEIPSPNSKKLMKLLRDVCKENGIMYRPDECFGYMYELPEKYEQMSVFDII